MANNLTEVIPSLLAQGLHALRQNSVMPRLVNNSYSDLAARKGDTIDVPLSSSIVASAVTPAATAPDPGDTNQRADCDESVVRGCFRAFRQGTA